MPIPPGKAKLYGKILGKNINLGKSPAQAKAIAEAAIKPGKQRKPKKKNKGGVE